VRYDTHIYAVRRQRVISKRSLKHGIFSLNAAKSVLSHRRYTAHYTVEISTGKSMQPATVQYFIL
jgi:hypothetical protein